jgi:diguanylate cyclase (GGDEF)-like protein/PAS domain S-box-containing protein
MIKKNRSKPNYLKNLRAQAEKKVVHSAGEVEPLPSWDRNCLVHELGVHRAELEMQNEELVRIAKELEDKTDRYVDLYDFAPTGYLTLDETGKIIEANLTIASLLGRERQKLLGQTLTQFMVEEDADPFYLLSRQLFTNGVAAIGNLRFVKADGSLIFVNINCLLAHENGKPLFRMAINDISRQVAVEEKLQLIAKVLENTLEGVIITDAQAHIITVNPAFTTITGYALDEVAGKNPSLLKSDRQGAEFYSGMWQSLKTSGHWEGEVWNRRKNEEIFPQWMSISAIKNEHGETTHYVGLFHDITTAKLNEARIHHIATHDALTDLPNRNLLWDRLDLMINQSHRDKKEIAVIFLDLDHFKAINDTHGHQIGDEVLILVARRLASCLRESDTVARMGGDEFVILLGNVAHRQAIGMLARKFLDAIIEPIWMHDLKFSLTTSMGISVFPADGLDSETLVKNADKAMYHAKEQGRNNFCFFTAEMDIEEKKHLALGTSLQSALSHNEFRLQYQPVADLHSGRIVEVEAFLRWQHPQMGPISPTTIIPLAEETGLIGPICNWVLRTGCEQSSAWQSIIRSKTPVKISLNIATYEYQRSDMVNTMRKILKNCGLPPEQVTLELTEDLLVKDPETSSRTLMGLNKLGVGLTIDDFGLGFSSLSFLHRFPVQTIKIDRLLIANMTHNARIEATVNTFIHFAHALGIKVAAEGVETEEQLQLLWAEGCDWIQGFYFSPPVETEEMTKLLQEDRRMVINESWLP